MKKLQLFLIFGLLTISMFSQSEKDQFVGGHVGLNYSTLRGKSLAPLFANEWKYSYSIGFDYQLFFTKVLGLGVQINYQNNGNGFRDFKNDGINDDLDGKIDIESELKCLNMPIEMCISPFNDKILVISYGLYLSKIFTSHIVGNPEQYVPYYDLHTNIDVSDKIEPIDFGITFSVESNVSLSKNMLLCAELNYNHGIKNIRKNSVASSLNSNIIFNVGLKMNLRD